MPDFSKGGYYNRIHSRAHNKLLIGMLVAGASAVALPLFLSNSMGLAFTYFAFLLVAMFAYKWGTRAGIVVGAILEIAGLILLMPLSGSGALLQASLVLQSIAFVALSIGLSGVGMIARDLQQIKFSHEVPKAADRERLLFLLDKELARAKRYRQPSSLAIVELRIMDKAEKAYGHHQTELLLRQVQLSLLQQLRRSDTLAWLEGPYFALLMPGTGRQAAETALERLKECMRRISARPLHRLGTDVSEWRVSILELKGEDDDPHEAMRKAASNLGPIALQRIGLRLQDQELAV